MTGEKSNKRSDKQKTFGYTSNKSKRKCDWRRNQTREAINKKTFGYTSNKSKRINEEEIEKEKLNNFKLIQLSYQMNNQ